MKILIVGGYGNFGKRLLFSLAKYYDFQLYVGGRNREHGEEFCRTTSVELGSDIRFFHLDIHSISSHNDGTFDAFRTLAPDIVVNAAGPFQKLCSKDCYALARVCIRNACHYIDLADARDYVANFHGELDEAAKRAGVMLITGASSVPGLSAAVIDHYLPQFQQLESVNYGIAPGNKTERGVGTVASILSYTGKPYSNYIDGRYQTIHGWQNLSRFDFGPKLGTRWLGSCNIPDISLFPQRYPGLQTLNFKAGLEVTVLHCGLWLLSWLSRFGVVDNWSRYTKFITKMSELFLPFGSEHGGMYMQLNGINHYGAKHCVDWRLIAADGSGPNVPTIATELVIRAITRGNIVAGARPCMGLFGLQAFFEVASRWGIYQQETINEEKCSSN